jgi:hypothetical protein
VQPRSESETVPPSTVEERARGRHNWPIRRFTLATLPDDDLSTTTTPEQRLAMMWPLAVDAWLMAGRKIPTYSRSDAPGRLGSLAEISREAPKADSGDEV